ncbi:MAG: hypothetical protein V7K68_18970 [Nostoc sp.]|uniref:hypothetical protein n=1 Tax=Nostoc sp. TaxID=1180 RepID=UPI002FFC99DC
MKRLLKGRSPTANPNPMVIYQDLPQQKRKTTGEFVSINPILLLNQTQQFLLYRSQIRALQLSQVFQHSMSSLP